MQAYCRKVAIRILGAGALSIILVGIPYSTKAEQTIDPHQASILVTLLSDIKSAVEVGGPARQPEKYKIISVRLAQCAVLFRMSAENASAQETQKEYRTASNILFRAGSALYPGNEESLLPEINKSHGALLQLTRDKKALFYFLRNCRDFLKPGFVRGAVDELLP